MKNIDIRDLLKKNRIYSYEVAASLGISESQFSKNMNRRELTDDEKEIIKSKIEMIKKGED